MTEHERLKVYLEHLNLAALTGSYEKDEVVVLSESGYDEKKLQNTIASKHNEERQNSSTKGNIGRPIE